MLPKQKLLMGLLRKLLPKQKLPGKKLLPKQKLPRKKLLPKMILGLRRGLMRKQ